MGHRRAGSGTPRPARVPRFSNREPVRVRGTRVGFGEGGAPPPPVGLCGEGPGRSASLQGLEPSPQGAAGQARVERVGKICGAALRHEVRHLRERRHLRVRRLGQPLRGLPGAIAPRHPEAEGPGRKGVPAVRRDEQDPPGLEPQPAGGEPVRRGVRLVGPHLVDREDLVQERREPGRLRRLGQHPRRAVREDGGGAARGSDRLAGDQGLGGGVARGRSRSICVAAR